MSDEERSLAANAEETLSTENGRYSPRITVRIATREDLSHAARIFEESFTGSYRYWSLRLLKVLEVLIAEMEGKVVGAAELYATEVEGFGKVGVISFIAVDKAYRRKGVGRELVRRAESLFRSKGCRYSAASTRSGNTASIGLFKSLGYSLHERGDPTFEALEAPLYAYEDDIIMVKRLR